MFNKLTLSTSLGFLILYILIIIAFVIIKSYHHKMLEKTQTELLNRVKTWFFIISGLFLLLIANKYITILGFMLISFFAFQEYVKSINIRPSDRSVVWFSYLMIPIQYLWIMIDWYNMAIVFIPVYVFLSIPLFLILSKETQGFLKSVGTIYWGMMAAVFCLSHVPLLFTLSGLSIQSATSFIFFLLLLTEINDVLQYIWGKALGNTKIIPSISPNKTKAGFFGGVFSTTLISCILAPIFTPFNITESLCIGFIIGISGFIGDLCMSAIKRDIGVKDYSTKLPGHGGVLDRLDSLIYTAPLFFHFIHYLYY